MVFQLRDDVLDVVATDEELGKPAGPGPGRGIYTLPVLLALRDPAPAPSCGPCSARPSTSPSGTRPGRSWPSPRAIADTVDGATRGTSTRPSTPPRPISARAPLGRSLRRPGPVSCSRDCPSRARRPPRRQRPASAPASQRSGRSVGKAITSRMLAHVGEQHDETVDPDAEPAGRRQAVLEGAEVVLVDGHGLVVAAGARRGLRLEAARWSSGSTSSEKALPSSRPATMGSNRSTRSGSARCRRASGDTSARVVHHVHRSPQSWARSSSRRARAGACPAPTTGSGSTPGRPARRRSSSTGVWTSTASPVASLTSSAMVARRQGGVRSSSRPW